MKFQCGVALRKSSRLGLFGWRMLQNVTDLICFHIALQKLKPGMNPRVCLGYNIVTTALYLGAICFKWALTRQGNLHETWIWKFGNNKWIKVFLNAKATRLTLWNNHVQETEQQQWLVTVEWLDELANSLVPNIYLQRLSNVFLNGGSVLSF